MTVRTELANIIAFVERLIDDEDNVNHSDQEIQDALDQNREELRYLKLLPIQTIASGGVVTYTTFEVPYGLGYIEENATLLDSNYDALTPATSDWTTGRWSFSTEPTRPVFILGWSYDPYGAAADLLEVRASMLAEDIQSFAVNNGSFTYAKKRSGPLELAEKYRSMSRSSFSVTEMIRTDVNVL